MDSLLLTDNFKELLLDPVEVQLQKLLGPDEAEDFLHPTFRDGAKKTLNPMAIQRKCMWLSFYGSAFLENNHVARAARIF